MAPPVRWRRGLPRGLRLLLLPLLPSLGAAAAASSDAAAAASPRSWGGWQGGADKELFWRQGYLILPGFASGGEVAELRRSLEQMLDAWEPPTSAAGCCTGDRALEAAMSSLRVEAAGREPDHSFILDSATKASFFMEPGAIDIVPCECAGAAGRSAAVLRPGVPKRSALRKVAHGLHMADGPVRGFVRSRKVALLAEELGWAEPVVAQTQYRITPPGAAGVDRHQDSTTVWTEPQTCLGMWLALEDADEQNGCLFLRPGSHAGEVRERLVRRRCGEGGCGAAGVRLEFEVRANVTRASEADFVPAPVRSGDLVVMHGTLDHVSHRSRDLKRSRESLQVHLVERSSRWPPDNWLQYPQGQDFMRLEPASRRSEL